MALEDLTGPNKFISNLVPANPPQTDPASQGSDHIQGIKNVLQNTFPGMAGAYAFGPTANPMTWNVGGAERMRIAANGDISFFGQTFPSAVAATGNGYGINTTVIVQNINANNAAQYINKTEYVSGTTYFIGFNINGVGKGSINSADGNTITYATSSDYRLKDKVAEMPSQIDRISALRPVTYKWKDGSHGEGFIAHELQQHFPIAVTGEKDSVDADGNPVYQGVDVSFIVPALVKAIQELKDEVDALKAK